MSQRLSISVIAGALDPPLEHYNVQLEDCSLQLLKKNYFTGSFKLSEWLHSQQRISYPIIQSIPWLRLSGNTRTHIFVHYSTFTTSVPFSNSLIFPDFSIANRFQPWTIFTKISILDVWLGSGYISETELFHIASKNQLLNFYF